MSPTPEEAKRYGLALAALQYGLGVIWDYRGPSWRCQEHFADDPAEALAAAAEGLGLEPVQLAPSVPEGYVLVELGDLEHIANLIDEAGGGKQYDPSWIRPRTLSVKEREDRLRQALAQIAALSSSPKEASTAQEPAPQTASRLRQAIEYALEDTSVEGRHPDGRAAFVGIGMRAYQGLVDALSSPAEAPTPNAEALAILARWEHHMDHPDETAPLELRHADIHALRAALGGPISRRDKVFRTTTTTSATPPSGR